MINNFDISRITNILNWFNKIGPTLKYICYSKIPYFQSKEIDYQLTRISVEIQDTFPEYSQRISNLKKLLFINNEIINIAPFCQIAECLQYLKNSIEMNINNNQWKYIHKKFHDGTKEKFLHGFYSDSVFTATYILIERLKIIAKHMDPQFQDDDGASLIDKLFSKNDPKILFCNKNTKTGKSIQSGYIEFFRGLILAIRNKKAHSPTEEINDIEAFQELVFISMLMTALDNRISPPIFDDE